MTRLEANRLIIVKLSKAVEALPQWRFHQILHSFGIIDQEGRDRFFEESVETLKLLNEYGFLNEVESQTVKES